MLDLRGLISLDNKTKRVNVLIVADGAGILGKCVKLVLTSGPRSSPPCCDLLLSSFRCSLHPSHSIPRSSHVRRSIPPASLSLVSLSSSTSIRRARDMGLNGRTHGKGRATGVVQAHPSPIHPYESHKRRFWTAVELNLNIYFARLLGFHVRVSIFECLEDDQRAVNEKNSEFCFAQRATAPAAV